MTLGELRTRIARTVGMSLSSSEDLALIDGWVNEAVLELLRETKVNVLTAAMTTTANVEDYTLDEDILSIRDLWYSPVDGQQSMLEPIPSRDLRAMRLRAGSVANQPRYYALEGAHLLMLYPTPTSSSDTLHVLYTPRPGLIADAEHQPSDDTKGGIPPEYHPTLEAYAKWKAAEAEEHRPSEYGMNFQAEWERGLGKIRADMNRKAGVFRGRKVPGRRPLFPMTPGTDLR